MVYGVLRFINFAHGDVYMVGAYLAAFAATGFLAHQSPFVAGVGALMTAMLGCAILGVLIERLAYRPVRRSGRLAALITAIGVSLLIENPWEAAATSTPRAYQIVGVEQPINFGLGSVHLTVDKGQTIVLLAAVILTLMLIYIVR